MGNRASLRRYAVISILAALATIVLKSGAYLITDSVGLLSDALESLVNLAAAIVAFIALAAAARPEDEDHRYGHSKAEYFSSGFEGALILLAAASIIYTSVRRLLAPQPIEQVATGLAISVAASLINLVVARVLFRAGRRYQSITLEADAHHHMSDVPHHPRPPPPPKTPPALWPPPGGGGGPPPRPCSPAGTGSTRSSPSRWRSTSCGPA